MEMINFASPWTIHTYLTHKPLLGPTTNRKYFNEITYCFSKETKKTPKENNCQLCNPRILADLT